EVWFDDPELHIDKLVSHPELAMVKTTME
ncbi:Lrp/AsnC family transcriptional regulator, partial [Pseudomonas sp. NPDC089918]